MSAPWKDQATIDRLLDETEVWAVVGLSGDPYRTAFHIAKELQEHGKRIVPVHPRAAEEDLEVLGEKAYATVGQIPFAVDVVDVFRRSEVAGESADDAVAAGAGAVWFQMGVVDEAAYERTTSAGVPMVMDVCPSQQWHLRDQRAAQG